MKAPDQIQHLLDKIDNMDHRERIVFEVNCGLKNSIHPLAYCLEIYVTFPFGKSIITREDQHRVLFQITGAAGKVHNGMPKTSIKRNCLNTKTGVLPKVWKWIS